MTFARATWPDVRRRRGETSSIDDDGRLIVGTVVNVPLPVLRESLGASLAQAQWVVEAYLLFLASLMLVGGALGDRWGRRFVFALGVALFAVASAAWGGAGG